MKQQSFFRRARAVESVQIADFQIRMAFETEGLMLNSETCQAGVRAVFDESKRGIYHVCLSEGQLVGCLLIQSEWSDWRNGEVWWIHSVFVLPEYRGRKLFQQFYSYIKKLAEEEAGVRGIRLYVDKNNRQAQHVYRQVGMDGDHYLTFEWMK